MRADVVVTDTAEWMRIVENVKPSPLYVSSDRQWFKNGLGMIIMFVEQFGGGRTDDGIRLR